MMAGAGGAMRATGWRATAIRFQQFGEGGSALTISLTPSRARGADDGGRRRRDASYGVARDSNPVSTIRSGGMKLSDYQITVRRVLYDREDIWADPRGHARQGHGCARSCQSTVTFKTWWA